MNGNHHSYSLNAEPVGAGELMRRLYIPALALLACSYPLTNVWVLKADLPPQLFNFIIKGIIATLFALSLASSINARRKPPLTFLPLYLFFALYGMRMIDDVMFNGIFPPGSSAEYVLLYFFGLTFMPAIAVALAFEEGDIESLGKWMFVLIALANISVSYYVLTEAGVGIDTAFSGRFQVDGEEANSSVLNPITISLHGAIMIVFCLGRIAAIDRMSLFNQIFHIGLIPVGFANLLVGGSRGPLLDLVVALALMVLSMIVTGLSRSGFKVRPVVILVMGMSITSFLIFALSGSAEISVLNRFESMFAGGGGRVAEERDYLFAEAWSFFVDSPLTGKSYLVANGVTFAHNSFLESLAAVGFYGGLAYIYSFYVYVQGVWGALTGKVVRYGYPIALVSVVYMALSMTSGSVSQSPEIWVMSSLMMCFAHAAASRKAPPAIARSNVGVPGAPARMAG